MHPRARPTQRPPAGDWRVWAYVAGRGAGKTRAGACWIQRRVDDGTMKLGCLIAPTAADIRDVMVEGPSGLLAVAPPWCRPRFESSKRRVEWPNGARAVCLSGEEPERARGLNIDTLWADELACWQRAESTWDLAMLALRAGTNPQALITTTPRRVAVLKRILAEATTVQTTDTTYANQAHLPREFLAQIVGLYENTRLGRQEIYAEFLETTEGVWFANFDPARHVSVEAEYHPAILRPLRHRRRHVAAHRGGVLPGPLQSGLRPAARDRVRRLPRPRCGEPEKCPRHQGAGRSTALSRPHRPGPPRPGRDGSIVARPGRLLASTSGCSARESSPGGRSTWCWTGSTPSSCCWTPAT